jgi:hypothetical protein
MNTFWKHCVICKTYYKRRAWSEKQQKMVCPYCGHPTGKQKGEKLITGDEAKVTLRQHTSPCSDCPFRRDSIQGWLGELSVDDWIQLAHGEGQADCHTTKQSNGAGWHCAGLAIYRANVCKSVHDPNAFRLPKDTEKVFSFGEFKKHHEAV